MDRGLTILKGKGYYTGEERDVIMCAVRRPEAVKLRRLIKRYDPSAFIIMCEAGEVIGEGFKPITKEI
ncbi:MAG: YitT family protein [Clostridia bacterium]|nr:YitT family protein [Clostridia bacterium]